MNDRRTLQLSTVSSWQWCFSGSSLCKEVLPATADHFWAILSHTIHWNESIWSIETSRMAEKVTFIFLIYEYILEVIGIKNAPSLSADENFSPWLKDYVNICLSVEMNLVRLGRSSKVVNPRVIEHIEGQFSRWVEFHFLEELTSRKTARKWIE